MEINDVEGRVDEPHGLQEMTEGPANIGIVNTGTELGQIINSQEEDHRSMVNRGKATEIQTIMSKSKTNPSQKKMRQLIRQREETTLTITEAHNAPSSSAVALNKSEEAVAVEDVSQITPPSRTKEVGVGPTEAHSSQFETIRTMAKESPTTNLKEAGPNENETTATIVEQCQLNKSSLSGLEEDEHKHMQAEEN